LDLDYLRQLQLLPSCNYQNEKSTLLFRSHSVAYSVV
jgi:hypothetical protein